MIRLYIDWNVMSQMKSGGHPDLAKIVDDDRKFFKIFSTSHIGDIAASDQGEDNKAQLTSDLEYIQKLTQGYCVFNNGTEVVIEQRDALQLYADRTDLGDVSDYFDPAFWDRLVCDMDPEMAAMVTPLIENFKNLPLDDAFRNAFENPETGSQMRQFLPELEDNYNAPTVIKSFLAMFSRLNTTAAYKELREQVQKGLNINRDRLFDTSDPYSMIDKAYQKLGVAIPDITTSERSGPVWYSELVNDYIRLDMHGFQEDKISVDKGRKQTFRNTQEDAFHTAFATTCDFYITSDNKNYKKAETLYEQRRINALVMKPAEFVEHYDDWLHFNGEEHLHLIPKILEHAEPVASNDNTTTFFGCFFIFDYFNKIHVCRDNSPFLILSRSKPTNDRYIYKNEIIVLIDKLSDVFGDDVENIGKYDSSEGEAITSNSWAGRKWRYNGILYHLRIINGYLQLYILSSPDNGED